MWYENSNMVQDIPREPAQVETPAPAETPTTLETLRAGDGRDMVPATFDEELKKIEGDIDADPAQVQEIRDRVRGIAFDMGMTGNELSGFIGRVQSSLANPPDETAVTAARKETTDTLRRHPQYGGDRTQESLTWARKLVSLNPQLGLLLEQTGLGNDAAVVMRLVERAHSLRIAGRLK